MQCRRRPAPASDPKARNPGRELIVHAVMIQERFVDDVARLRPELLHKEDVGAKKLENLTQRRIDAPFRRLIGSARGCWANCPSVYIGGFVHSSTRCWSLHVIVAVLVWQSRVDHQRLRCSRTT